MNREHPKPLNSVQPILATEILEQPAAFIFLGKKVEQDIYGSHSDINNHEKMVSQTTAAADKTKT